MTIFFSIQTNLLLAAYFVFFYIFFLEELCLSIYKEAKGNWAEDYDKYVKDMVQPSQPCYILFRQVIILIAYPVEKEIQKYFYKKSAV